MRITTAAISDFVHHVIPITAELDATRDFVGFSLFTHSIKLQRDLPEHAATRFIVSLTKPTDLCGLKPQRLST